MPAPGRRLIALLLSVSVPSGVVGCLSQEYRISKGELERIARLPPEVRGNGVRVVQQMGTRRDPPGEAMAPPYQGGGETLDTVETVDVRIDLSGRPFRPGRSVPTRGGFHGGPPASSSPSSTSTSTSTSSWRNAPVRASGGGGGGNGRGGGGGSGGGGAERVSEMLVRANPREILAVVAVVVVAIAVVGVASVGITEGIRFDGQVRLNPGQPVHLDGGPGVSRVIALGDMTPENVAWARFATVNDDEAYGVGWLDRAPLDRRGFTFKLDMGPMQTVFDHYSVGGLASNIQLGYFPHQRFGILGNLSLTGGTDGLGGTFMRHAVGLEAQAFPLQFGRLHVGGFGNVGSALVESDAVDASGLALGAGVLLEVALTTRLAFTLRGAWTTVHAPAGWEASQMITMGLAIY